MMDANQQPPLGQRRRIAGSPEAGWLESYCPSVRLDLPEQGCLELPLAGVGSRGLATLMDLAWLFIGPGSCVWGVWLFRPGWLGERAVQGALLALLLLLPSVGPLVFELLYAGQSPGKRRVGIRVLSLDGRRPSFNQLVLRNILRLVDFLPLGYLAGVASLFVSERAQRLGDVVAGTLVVRDGRRALEDVRGLAEAASVGPEFHGLPAPLLMGLRLLLDPLRTLTPEVRQLRREELLQAVRRCRPDLGELGDEQLWAWLGGGLS
jgi:uncharacterized RDD family membrane protein YckC